MEKKESKPLLYGKFSKESMNPDGTWSLWKNDRCQRIPTREFKIRAFPSELNGTQGLEQLIELNENKGSKKEEKAN